MITESKIFIPFNELLKFSVLPMISASICHQNLKNISSLMGKSIATSPVACPMRG